MWCTLRARCVRVAHADGLGLAKKRYLLRVLCEADCAGEGCCDYTGRRGVTVELPGKMLRRMLPVLSVSRREFNILRDTWELEQGMRRKHWREACASARKAPGVRNKEVTSKNQALFKKAEQIYTKTRDVAPFSEGLLTTRRALPEGLLTTRRADLKATLHSDFGAV